MKTIKMLLNLLGLLSLLLITAAPVCAAEPVDALRFTKGADIVERTSVYTLTQNGAYSLPLDDPDLNASIELNARRNGSLAFIPYDTLQDAANDGITFESDDPLLTFSESGGKTVMNIADGFVVARVHAVLGDVTSEDSPEAEQTDFIVMKPEAVSAVNFRDNPITVYNYTSDNAVPLCVVPTEFETFPEWNEYNAGSVDFIITDDSTGESKNLVNDDIPFGFEILQDASSVVYRGGQKAGKTFTLTAKALFYTGTSAPEASTKIVVAESSVSGIQILRDGNAYSGPQTADIQADAAFTLTAGYDGDAANVRWLINNPVDEDGFEIDCASVDSRTGQVTLLSPVPEGKTVTVTCTVDGQYDDSPLELTVTGTPAVLTGLAPCRSDLYLDNDAIWLYRNLKSEPASAPLPDETALVWSSDNPELPVGDLGFFNAPDNVTGTANITVYLADDPSIQTTFTVHVGPSNPVTAVSAPQSLTLKKGETTSLGAAVVPEDTTDDPDLLYSSSRSDIVRVDADGTITAVSEGTAEITSMSAADPSKKAVTVVTVVSDSGGVPGNPEDQNGTANTAGTSASPGTGLTDSRSMLYACLIILLSTGCVLAAAVFVKIRADRKRS